MIPFISSTPYRIQRSGTWLIGKRYDYTENVLNWESKETLKRSSEKGALFFTIADKTKMSASLLLFLITIFSPFLSVINFGSLCILGVTDAKTE